MLAVACSNEQKVPVTATPRTAAGNPAQVDGALTVTVQSGDGTVEQDPLTPLVFKAVSGANPGTTVFLVEADADLGSGVQTISDTVELTVTSATAANFGLAAGTPEPK
jgi:hypothetical protein